MTVRLCYTQGAWGGRFAGVLVLESLRTHSQPHNVVARTPVTSGDPRAVSPGCAGVRCDGGSDMPRPRNTIADFWHKVDTSGGPDACWPWLGGCQKALTTTGVGCYGRFSLANRTVAAHRFAYAVSISPIPNRLHVLHSCDNPPCCNPTHLFLGTELDNSRDKIAKGRTNWASGERAGMRKHPERHARGEANGAHKVTADQVREIRSKAHLPGMTQTTLAKMYGLSQAGVWKILHRESWPDDFRVIGGER